MVGRWIYGSQYIYTILDIKKHGGGLTQKKPSSNGHGSLLLFLLYKSFALYYILLFITMCVLVLEKAGILVNLKSAARVCLTFT